MGDWKIGKRKYKATSSEEKNNCRNGESTKKYERSNESDQKTLSTTKKSIHSCTLKGIMYRDQLVRARRSVH